MLTNTQQQLIQSITEQFEKLNASAQPTKYNLVDIQPLIDKSERIRQLDEEEKTTEKMWRDIQVNELHRITNLLLEDLPKDTVTIKINPWGNMLRICKIRFLSNGEMYIDDHYEDSVEIGVKAIKKMYWDEYSQKHRYKYSGICYTTEKTIGILEKKDVEYSTIEELCATDEFKDTLRKRVL